VSVAVLRQPVNSVIAIKSDSNSAVINAYINVAYLSLGSSLSIVTRLRDGRGFNSRLGDGLFFSSPRVQTGSEAHPASSYIMCTGAFPHWVQRPGVKVTITYM